MKTKIELASDALLGARRMLHNRYAWRGYNLPPESCEMDSRITLVTRENQRILGTLTLGFDHGEGFLADEIYRDRVDALRDRGRRLCELTRLAIAVDVDSKAVLLSLFQTAYRVGRQIFQATDVLIEINPRHATFYCRQFGFEILEAVRLCPRVNAPAILLHLNMDRFDVGRLWHIGKTISPQIPRLLPTIAHHDTTQQIHKPKPILRAAA